MVSPRFKSLMSPSPSRILCALARMLERRKAAHQQGLRDAPLTNSNGQPTTRLQWANQIILDRADRNDLVSLTRLFDAAQSGERVMVGLHRKVLRREHVV